MARPARRRPIALRDPRCAIASCAGASRIPRAAPAITRVHVVDRLVDRVDPVAATRRKLRASVTLCLTSFSSHP